MEAGMTGITIPSLKFHNLFPGRSAARTKKPIEAIRKFAVTLWAKALLPCGKESSEESNHRTT